MLPHARRVSISLSFSLLALFAAAEAAAACRQPRMTAVTEKNGANCDVRTCGFIIAHWAGAEGCNHYNIRERSGKQFEAPGTNRGQLHNQRSAQFPGRFAPNNTIHVSVQGCTRNFFGKSSCGAFSNEISHRVNDSNTSPKGVACRGFAPNAPVIIRITGPGASIATVTVANNQRITADARGNINIRLFGAQICKRGGGTVTFTAEDQDNPKSAPVSSKCAP